MARYYFHLADQHEAIPDNDGLEVSDLVEACSQTRKAVEEFRQESPSMAAEWHGWRLDIADASGAVVFSICLDGALH